MLKKYGDILSGAFLALLSIFMLTQTGQIIASEGTVLGAGFLPLMIFSAVLILALFILYTGVKKAKITEKEVPDFVHNYGGAAITFVALAVYVALLQSVGFVIMSALYLLLTFFVVSKKEERKPVSFVIVAIVASLAIYLTFSKGFGIRLPNGILKGIF